MKVGRLRWWWRQRWRIVAIPTQTRRYAMHDVDIHMTLTDTVPLYDEHLPLSCTFHEVFTGMGTGELVRGTALLLRVKDGWGYYRCSRPLRGRTGCGDWRARDGKLQLAAIALRPIDHGEPAMTASPR